MMSETQMNVRLPVDLARDIKIDAIRQGQPVQEWIKEAALERLRRRSEEPAEAG